MVTDIRLLLRAIEYYRVSVSFRGVFAKDHIRGRKEFVIANRVHLRVNKFIINSMLPSLCGTMNLIILILANIRRTFADSQFIKVIKMK